MSVIADFSIFPMDKGESVGAYAARAVKIIKDSGLSYHVSPMGTSIEGEWDEVMGVVGMCLNEIKKDCDRVYMTIKIDYRKKGGASRIGEKIKRAESSL